MAERLTSSLSFVKVLNWVRFIILVLIFITGVLILYRAFIAKPVPRSVIERELIEAKAHVKAQPFSAQAHFKLGTTYFRMQAYTKANRELNRAIKLDPKFSGAHYALALVYKDQGKINEAKKQLKKAIKLSPNFELPHFEVGKIYLKEKNYKEAIEAFKKSIAIFPTSADTHYFLGQAYEKSGQIDLAIKYNEALKYIPDYKAAKKALDELTKK